MIALFANQSYIQLFRPVNHVDRVKERHPFQVVIFRLRIRHHVNFSYVYLEKPKFETLNLLINTGDLQQQKLLLILFKRKHDGTVEKYTARIVVLGYGPVSGVDVFNTFAPVVKSVTVRLLLTIVFSMNMHIPQLDVSNAFCYANITGDVYMAPTPDFDLPTGHCLIKKSL